MGSNPYSDVVGLQIGKWVICMKCVTTFFLRDARESELVKKKDVVRNAYCCIRCGMEIESDLSRAVGP